MKRETKLLWASGLGFFTVLSICVLNKMVKSKKRKVQDIYLYTDEHRHFDISENSDELEGVELYALK